MAVDTIKYLTQEELERLLTAIAERPACPTERAEVVRKRNMAMFSIAYHHGLRRGEVLMLTVRHVDLERARIRIDREKHGLGGEFPLLPRDVQLLQEYLEAKEALLKQPAMYLFPNFAQYHDAPLSGRMLDDWMKDYGKRAGLPQSKRHFHVLRHSIATHLLDAGADIMFIKTWLGHTNISSTTIYAQITNKARDQQAEQFFGSSSIVHFDFETCEALEDALFKCKVCSSRLSQRDFNPTYWIYLCDDASCPMFGQPQHSRLKLESDIERYLVTA